MIDYIVMFKLNNNGDIKDTLITLEVDSYIEDIDLLEDILTEYLKDYLELETNDFEIVEYYTLTQIEQANLYRITEDDVYYENEYR